MIDGQGRVGHPLSETVDARFVPAMNFLSVPLSSYLERLWIGSSV
jgi:hypothetical protein